MSKLLHELNRRNLLKFMGNAVLFAPVMRTFAETQVFGADATPKRAIFYYFPSGHIPDKFFPAAGALSSFPEMTSPLARVKNDVIILRDSVYNTGGSHQGGMNYALTGVPDSGPATSIDTLLGDKFKGIFPVVRLGICSNFEGGGAPQSCSFLGPNMLAPRQDNPSKAFQDLFGGSMQTTQTSNNTMTSTMAPAPTSGLTYATKKSLLDSNLAQLNSLQKKLGNVEKVKLDAHVEAIRELERRIDALNGTGSTSTGGTTTGGAAQSGQCTRTITQTKTFDPNDASYDAPYKKVENYNIVADMMTEITIQALACRMTNVVLFQHGHSVFEMGFTNGQPAAGGKGHHTYSHYDAEGSVAGHVADQQYMMTKLANLIDGLGKCSEGDKSVLYNSVIMGFSELGDSALHSMKNVGIIIAGQNGGYFKTGRCVSANGEYHNKTLVSIFDSFGVANNSVGDASITGTMPGLKG